MHRRRSTCSRWTYRCLISKRKLAVQFFFRPSAMGAALHHISYMYVCIHGFMFVFTFMFICIYIQHYLPQVVIAQRRDMSRSRLSYVRELAFVCHGVVLSYVTESAIHMDICLAVGACIHVRTYVCLYVCIHYSLYTTKVILPSFTKLGKTAFLYMWGVLRNVLTCLRRTAVHGHRPSAYMYLCMNK